MFTLVLLATAALAFRIWVRIDAMNATIASLSARIETLERWRNVAFPPPAAPEQPASPPAPVVAAGRAASVRSASNAGASTTSPAPAPAGTHTTAQGPVTRNPLETRIGSRWLLYVGVAAIVIGIAYFEKLAIDNHWISATARVFQGAIAGALLIAGGQSFVRHGYRVYGQILSGCGVAILYVSTYAAFNFYQLIGLPVAFALMATVTTLAAWLADRQRSQGLALVAVGGGFATPFLLPSPTVAEAALFGCDTILIAGTMALSRRRDWPTLNAVSYGFTVLTFLSWCANFYTSSTYLTTEIFLTVFCGMFLYIRGHSRRSGQPAAGAERAILSTAPIGYYLASIVILFDQSSALLVYLILFSLAGIVASTRGGAAMRIAFWFATATPLLAWSCVHAGRGPWLTGGLAAWTAVCVLNTAGVFEATLWNGRRFATRDIVLLHLNALGCYAGASLLIVGVYPNAVAALAAGLAVAAAAGGVVLASRFRDEALQLAALAFTFATIAIARQFEGAPMISAWAAEGAAIVWIGLRERREWLRVGGAVVFGLAVVRLVALLFSEPPLGQLLLINRRALCGLFVIALSYAVAFAHEHDDGPGRYRVETGVSLLTAKLLLLAVASSEIVAYWLLHPAPPFAPASHVIVAALVAGAAIMWLGLRRRQEWLRAVGGATIAVAAFSLFSIQLQPAPRGYVTVVNGRTAAGVAAVLVLYLVAILHRRGGRHLESLGTTIGILATSASLLTLSLLTSEIDAFWAARGAAEAWSIARESLHAVAWSGSGGFLIWHGLTARRGWIRAIGGALVAAGVLLLLRVQFAGETLPYLVVANARVVVSVVVVALLYGLASLYRHAGDVAESRCSPAIALSLAANALTLTLLTSEIAAYWHVRDARHLTAFAAESHFAREMMLSITWATYATLLIVVGLRRNYAPIRYFAMTVFAVTIVKVFAIDLAELDSLYRVLSVVGLGITLLLTSYLYHRNDPQSAGAAGSTDS